MTRGTEIIIGLAGRKRSGKTSAAETLRLAFAREGYEPIRFGFTDFLKSKVSEITGGLSDTDKCMVRPALQNLADFLKQRYGERYFINQWHEIYHVFLERGVNVFIIDDVRYPFEAEWIKEQGGLVLKMVRDGDADQGDQHPSETSVDDIQAEEWTLPALNAYRELVVGEIIEKLS